MRHAVLSLVLAVFLVPAALPQDAVKTIDVSKKQVLREGALQYRVVRMIHYNGMKGSRPPNFTVRIEVVNISKDENVPQTVWGARLRQQEMADARGKKFPVIAVTRNSPRDVLRPTWKETLDYTYEGKLDPQMKVLYMTLQGVDGTEEVRFAVLPRDFQIK